MPVRCERLAAIRAPLGLLRLHSTVYVQLLQFCAICLPRATLIQINPARPKNAAARQNRRSAAIDQALSTKPCCASLRLQRKRSALGRNGGTDTFVGVQERIKRSQVDMSTNEPPAWDQRYAGEDYLFGERPNRFLASQAPRLKRGQSALALADGEARNGVWLAEQGLDVLSVDASAVAQAKARRLARSRGVQIRLVTGRSFDLAIPGKPLRCDCGDFLPIRRPIAARHAV
jgi:hypothetical protein